MLRLLSKRFYCKIATKANEKANPVDGQRRRLSDEHAPQAVGHAQLRVLQDELHVVVGKLGYLHGRLVGVRHCGFVLVK